VKANEYVSTSSSYTAVEEIGSCIGSGSYGTVHYLTVVNEQNGERERVVGKRAWTESELLEQYTDLSREKLKDKATRCRYYWSVEKHCFEKMERVAGLPTYRGVVTDSENRNWMLFDVLEMATQEEARSEIALSLQDLMERDRVELKQDAADNNGEHHHLHSIGKALLIGDDDDSLTATLDVVLEQLLEILSHVHAHSIVHRDLKPSNLLIASQDGFPRLVLIDFGSAGDLSTAGLLKENIGLSNSRVAISPIYAAPEVFVDPSDSKHAVNFDCFSAALLCCQLLFQYLDERTESGFYQQVTNSQWDLDVWLQSALQSKVRPTGLDQALQVLEDRPGLWRLLQDMLRPRPADRLSSKEALKRWKKVLDNALSGDSTRDVRDDPDLYDGPYLLDVLDSLQICEIPTVWPLHFVASFQRKASMGLYLAESDADTSDMDHSSLQKWKQATADASPGEVFVQGIVPGGQAAQLGVFAVGDRLQGVGELPLAGGGFERAVEMVRVKFAGHPTS
jgi:Protein kinase domain